MEPTVDHHDAGEGVQVNGLTDIAGIPANGAEPERHIVPQILR